jgi:AraC family transcriptional regulator
MFDSVVPNPDKPVHVVTDSTMNAMDAPEFSARTTSHNYDQFAFDESIYPAGLRMPAHDHEPAYLSVIVSGAYTEYGSYGARTCKPGMVVYHPPGDRHAVDFHNSEVRIFRVQMKSQWLQRMSDFFNELEPEHFYGGLVSSLCRRIYREFRRSDVYSALVIEGLMMEITAELARRQRQSFHRIPPRWLHEAHEIIATNISEPPALDSLAQMVGVHPVSLAREFRRHYGSPIGEYIRQLRIEAACQQLSDSEATLSMVAADAGFYDQSHFTNSFKRYTGMTPAQYRATRLVAQQK